MDKTYRDSDGNRVDLAVLCCREPGWATNRIKELTRQVEALVRGNDQMRLLAGLPLPPDVVAKLREADRLRKLFDDAGAGEHDVLALIDYYQEVTLDAEARLEAIRKLLAEENGHECVGEGICLACRIAKACVAPTGGDK